MLNAQFGRKNFYILVLNLCSSAQVNIFVKDLISYYKVDKRILPIKNIY